MKLSVWFLTAAFIVSGCGGNKTESQIPTRPFDHTYADYASILKQYVSDGLVNYSALKANRSGLDSLVDAIAHADLGGTSREQRIAFYINAYNILTLRSIVDAYPVESIKDIDGVWDKKKWRVAGEKLTLNDIEHEILRKKFSEPRIHVAINCASIGCPPLASTPYYSDSLEAQLDLVSRNFALSADHNRFDTTKKKAAISSIFDWFGDDFVDKYYSQDGFASLSKKENAALNFLIEHFPQEEKEALTGVDFEVSYLEYDWSLNELK